MPEPWLKSGSYLLSQEQLKSGKWGTPESSQAEHAFQFCHRWLSGQNEFSFMTSGSTGSARNISFRREQMVTSAELTKKALQLQPGITALVALDVNFIAGAMMLVRCLIAQMNMVVVTPVSNPLRSVSEKIDFAALVPLQVSTLLNEEKEKLNQLKIIIIGGAPVNNELAEQLQSVTPAVYATYGMTETLSHIALQKLNGKDRQDYFQLLHGISISTDKRQCLVISAPHLGNEPIVTGDVVSMLDKNRFNWIGRIDRVINTGGIKVQTEKVEEIVSTVFHRLNLPNRFFISGRSDQKFGEKVSLLIEGVLTDNEIDTVKTQMRLLLSEYECPREILLVKNFSETSTQKIDRIQTLKSIQ